MFHQKMLKFNLKQGHLFRDIFHKLKDYTSSTKWMATSDGLIMKCLDSSNVSQCDVNMNLTLFKHYQCESKLPIKMVFNMKTTDDLFKSVKGKDGVTIEAKQDADTIKIGITSVNGKLKTECKKFRMYTDDNEFPPLANVGSNTIIMDSDKFKSLIESMVILHDYVKIEMKNNSEVSLTVDAASGPIVYYIYGNVVSPEVKEVKEGKEEEKKKKRKLPSKEKDDDEDEDSFYANINYVSPVTIEFSLKYLKLFADFKAINKKVTITLGNDVPIYIQYNFDTDKQNKSYIRFLLAPKSNDDDNNVNVEQV